MNKGERDYIDSEIRKHVECEVRDYRALEQYIKEETDRAVRKVDSRLAIIACVVAVVSSLGIWPLIQTYRQYVTDRITNHIVEKAVDKAIRQSAEDTVSDMVPAMIGNSVSETRSELVSEFISRIEGVSTTLEKRLDALTLGMDEAESRSALIPMMVNARGDERRDYEELVQIMDGTNSVAQYAEAAVRDIQRTYYRKKILKEGLNITVRRSDERVNSEEELVSLVHADLEHNCDGAINDIVALNNKSFVATLVYAVEHAKRLNSVYLAIMGIEKLSGSSFPPLGIEEVRRWWSENKTDERYNGPYEEYHKIVERRRSSASSVSVTNLVEIDSIISDAAALAKKYPHYLPISVETMLMIATRPGAPEKRFDNGRRELYERALSVSRALMNENDDWWNLKAYHDVYTGGFEATVSNRLAVSPAFEMVMKKSGLYNKVIFEQDRFGWPSRKRQSSPISTIDRKDCIAEIANSATGRERTMSKAYMVGCAVVEIRKGKRILSELPFEPSDSIQNPLSNLTSPNAIEGDAISWSIDGKEYRFKFNGEEWLDENDESSDDQIVPIGRCAITYERQVDKKTQFSFAGEVSPD